MHSKSIDWFLYRETLVFDELILNLYKLRIRVSKYIWYILSKFIILVYFYILHIQIVYEHQ